MSRLLTPPSSDLASDLDDMQHLVLENVSWAFYERFLKEIGNRHIRVNYDQGRMEIMSPLPEHDGPSRLIGRLIQTITFIRNLPIRAFGSTTFRKKDKAKGLEPDECFYIEREDQVRGLKRWNSVKHPPPDLVVESDITHRSINRMSIYAALGVPEIWRWDGQKIECFQLRRGRYRTEERSLAFPFLKPADLSRFVRMSEQLDDNQIVRELMKWLETSPKP